MDLDDLTEVIDRLHGADPSIYSDAESIEAVQRQLARLDAFVTKATGAFEASRNWEPDGASSAASWLAAR